jgi:hypothetical protein
LKACLNNHLIFTCRPGIETWAMANKRFVNGKRLDWPGRQSGEKPGNSVLLVRQVQK